MNTRRFTAGLAALAMLVALAGCSKQQSTAARLGHVSINLTDAPGDFEEVNLVVTGVSIHRGDEDSGGWETLKHDTTTYDLLQLRNGVFTQLGAGDVPAGHYTQVRLHIGEGSNVVVDGVVHPLTIPSGMQSGYKLVGEFDVPAGGGVELTLDFDAARSVLLTGNQQYKLKPTVRVIVNHVATTGAIIGHLLPEGVAASIYALAGTDTVQTTAAGSDGRFTLAALLPGSYSVAVHPTADYRDTTLTGVDVAAGATTDVGDVQLTATGSSSGPIVGNP